MKPFDIRGRSLLAGGTSFNIRNVDETAGLAPLAPPREGG